MATQSALFTDVIVRPRHTVRTWAIIGVCGLHVGLVAWIWKSKIETPTPMEAPDHPLIVGLQRLVSSPPPQAPPTRSRPTFMLHVPTTVALPPLLPGIEISPTPKPVAEPEALPQPKSDPPIRHLIQRPSWARVPNGDDFATYYPDRAQRLGKEGAVRLTCSVQGDGRLSNCAVASEDAPGYGFADATLMIARLFRMKPQEEDGRPVDGATVDVTVQWKLPR